jgi:hypothetical protein
VLVNSRFIKLVKIASIKLVKEFLSAFKRRANSRAQRTTKRPLKSKCPDEVRALRHLKIKELAAQA